MVVSVLPYGSEPKDLCKIKESHIYVIEMKFLEGTEWCASLDHMPDCSLREEIQMFWVLDKIQDNKDEWENHKWMEDNKIPEVHFLLPPYEQKRTKRRK